MASVRRDLNRTLHGADHGGVATNRRILLTRLPESRLSADVFSFDDAPTPSPGPGEVLCRTLYISIDPANRAWMQGRTYRARLDTNEVMPANTLCEVVSGDLPRGTLVLAQSGWQDYAVLPVAGLDPVPEAPVLRQYLGALGITGMAAYFGLHNVARIQEGDTVVVSAAAGATGHLVGQMAAIYGCRVVGIAGSRAKNRWLVEELGFDGAVDYHDADWRDQVRSLCGAGIDVYFDNVGGLVLETLLPLMNVHGRIACCGAIASYDTGAPDTRVAGIPGRLVNSRLRMEGFLARDFKETWASARKDIAAWLAADAVRSVIEVIDGLDRAPEALIGLLHGDNVGKRVVQVTATRLDGSPLTLRPQYAITTGGRQAGLSRCVRYLAGPGSRQAWKTAPDARSAATSGSLNPKSESTASVCSPTSAAAAGRGPGVREKRGAGSGWTRPPASVKTRRAARCGWVSTSSGARTGVTQASRPAKAVTHSSRVRPATVAAISARCRGHCARSC